jgi:hypothetical protein
MKVFNCFALLMAGREEKIFNLMVNSQPELENAADLIKGF